MAQIFDGTEGAPIALADFQAWKANYQATIGPNEIKAHFFGYHIINKILGQPGCKGIRIYYGIDGNGTKQLLLAGAEANMNDMLPATQLLSAGDPNTLGDASFPCPPYCNGGGGGN